MITVIASVQVKSGREAEFESIFGSLAAAVARNEPATLVFNLMRSRKDPDGYRIVEVYESESAWANHKEQQYTRSHVKQLHALFASASAEVMESAVSASARPLSM